LITFLSLLHATAITIPAGSLDHAKSLKYRETDVRATLQYHIKDGAIVFDIVVVSGISAQSETD
jgi:hypothetical protein